MDRVSLREKGVDLNVSMCICKRRISVSLREKGVDLNNDTKIIGAAYGASPFVRREWI